MTIMHSPRSDGLSGKLSQIPEDEDGSSADADSRGEVVSRRPSPSRSLPTEYHQSFRRQKGPRPRNPVAGWQARNVSNILRSGPEPSPQPPSRAGRRPPPELWLARQANSQIFPRDSAQTVENGDVNNNPLPIQPIVAGGRRRTGRWPWQTRAQTSSIFSDMENVAPQPRPHSRSNWPWQERAKRSTIFEVLSGEGNPVTNKTSRRTYEWDQRQSKQMAQAVQLKSETPEAGSANPPSHWPWQERAKNSVVFRSPEKPTCPRPVHYVWDQRKSRFSIQLDPEAKFPKGSSYKDTFVQWRKVRNDQGLLKAAGKPCYKEDDAEDKGKSEMSADRGKRKFKPKEKEILALAAPLPKSDKLGMSLKNVPSLTSISSSKRHSGKSCMELVPAGYRFSSTKTGSGRKAMKSI